MTAAVIVPTDWLATLRSRVAALSIAAVARELGYSRTALSLVLAGKYGASTKRLAQAVLDTYCRYQCPHLQREIAFLECKAIANQPFSASSPMQVRQWRACQTCERNPRRKAK